MHTPEPMSGTILLVDRDERLPGQRDVLEKEGFTVVTATSADDGMKKAREVHPDMVISEVMLEHPDAGFVLGYQLKSDPKLAGVPLILLSSVFQNTGTVFDLNSPQARQWIKADAYLERPITPDRLIARVRSVLTTARAHRGGCV